ncbi:hypothetical protein GJ496_009169 [Pomphorhynchus laevis]|nr:hypothetical protein GJ496_009169 [Pomphorhynchus laevis]
MEQNHEVSQFYNNPDLTRQTMEMIRNPTTIQEITRNHDRALNNIESLPSGYNKCLRWLLQSTLGISEQRRRAINLDNKWDMMKYDILLKHNLRNQVSEELEVSCGVRQVSVLRPMLLYVVIDKILNIALSRDNDGDPIEDSEISVSDLTYADDIVMHAENFKRIESMIVRVVRVASPFCLIESFEM